MRSRNESKELRVRQKALELLVKLGFEGFSMQKLAKAAAVSPATLYIYYKDKEDLIIQLGIEEGRKMTDATMKGFDPQMSFEEGLRVQWHNRSRYWLEEPVATKFYEQIKHSSLRDKIIESINIEFREIMSQFVHNAVKNKELLPGLPLEVFWTMAYGPLVTLIRFHQDGRSIGNKQFELNDEMMNQTFALVIKALKP